VPTLATASGGGRQRARSRRRFPPFGTTVRFLPIVLGGGRIYLEVEPQFSFPTRRTCSRRRSRAPAAWSSPHHPARANLGGAAGRQTFAIGGMIFTASTATRQDPGAGRLPFVGTGFSKISYTNRGGADHPGHAAAGGRHGLHAMAKFLPGEETRSPDDFELFLEESLKHRAVIGMCATGAVRAGYKNGPTADMYPCRIATARGACDLGCMPARAVSSGPLAGRTCGNAATAVAGRGNCGSFAATATATRFRRRPAGAAMRRPRRFPVRRSAAQQLPDRLQSRRR